MIRSAQESSVPFPHVGKKMINNPDQRLWKSLPKTLDEVREYRSALIGSFQSSPEENTKTRREISACRHPQTCRHHSLARHPLPPLNPSFSSRAGIVGDFPHQEDGGCSPNLKFSVKDRRYVLQTPPSKTLPSNVKLDGSPNPQTFQGVEKVRPSETAVPLSGSAAGFFARQVADKVNGPRGKKMRFQSQRQLSLGVGIC